MKKLPPFFFVKTVPRVDKSCFSASLFSNSRLGREYEASSDYTASEVVSAYDLEVYDCNADSYEDRYSEDDCGFSVRAVYENGNERKVRMEGSISEFLEEIFSA